VGSPSKFLLNGPSKNEATLNLAPQDKKAAIRSDPGIMLKIMTERLAHRAYVACDFGPDIPNSSRFFGGPIEGE
jgi:hypothetical protein